MNPLDHITSRLAKTIWVVLVKDSEGKLTLLANPGLDQPWYVNNPNPIKSQQIAEMHAKACDGMAATWEDAFRLLKKENPNFEKELHKRIEQVQKGIVTVSESVTAPFVKPSHQSSIRSRTRY